MRPARVGSTVGVIVTLLVGILSAPADAGSFSDEVELKLGKHVTGPFDPIGVRVNVPDEGDAKNAYFKVKSISGADEDAALRQISIDLDGYRTKYFTKNGVPITTAVKDGSGYGFDLKANKPKLFRVRVVHFEGAEETTCIDIRAVDASGDYAPVELGVNLNPPCP